RKAKSGYLTSFPELSLSLGRRAYVAVQYLDHSLSQSISLSIFSFGNELGIGGGNQMISHFVNRAAGLPTKLNIFLIRVSPKTFGNVCSDRLSGASELTIECEAFLHGQLFH